jgi:hypothetical protein
MWMSGLSKIGMSARKGHLPEMEERIKADEDRPFRSAWYHRLVNVSTHGVETFLPSAVHYSRFSHTKLCQI